jgi:Mrp family chromosome partitioning ATPase
MSKLLTALRQIDAKPTPIAEASPPVVASDSEPFDAARAREAVDTQADSRQPSTLDSAAAPAPEPLTGEGAMRTVAELNHLLEEALAAQQIDLANEIIEPLELESSHELPAAARDYHGPLEAIAVSREYADLADRLLEALNIPLPAVAMFATVAPALADSFWLLPLAIAAARSHAGRVLIVEADGDVPRWPAHLGIEADSGMVDALKDFGAWRDSIRRTAVPRIDLLPRGSGIWSCGSEANEQLKSFLIGAKTDYQLILVAAGNSDRPAAAAMAENCDGVVLVVGLETTARSAARQAKQSLESDGARMIGTVVRN